MHYRGRIELSKELTFSQAEYLRLFFSANQTRRIYPKANLNICKDGRGLEWNRSDDTKYLEIAIADVINLYLAQWGIFAHGVIAALGTKQEGCFDIVVLKNKVKVLKGGEIKNISPSPNL